MRLLIFTLSLLFMLGANAQKTYVLVVGVSSYQDSRMNVTQTTNNAKSFAQKMKTQTPDVSILTSSYANHDNVLAKLKAICRGARSTDRIVFYFAGHGGVDETQTGCICAYDEPIYYSELMSCFKQSKAKEKIMLVEACHSGSTLTSYIDPGVTCLASSRMNEYSYYHDLIGAGYFSNAVLVGLQGKADANKDMKITVRELYNFVYSYVVGKSGKQQHPQLISSKAGQSIILFDCSKL